MSKYFFPIPAPTEREKQDVAEILKKCIDNSIFFKYIYIFFNLKIKKYEK